MTASSTGHQPLPAMAEAMWPRAQRVWSPITRLHRPTLLEKSSKDALAWIDLRTMSVHVNLRRATPLMGTTAARSAGPEELVLALLAHEVGHYVLAPGDMATAARIHMRVRSALIDCDEQVGMVANLWCDLLINDELQRHRGVSMISLLEAVEAVEAVEAAGAVSERRVRQETESHGREIPDASGPQWWPTYLRCYEIAWELAPGTLHRQGVARETEARLMARLARVYASAPVQGAAGFAALLRPMIMDEDLQQKRSQRLRMSGRGRSGRDCGGVTGAGELPVSVIGDTDLLKPVIHPAQDPLVLGADPADPLAPRAPEDSQNNNDGAALQGAGSRSQDIQPADLSAVARSLGVDMPALEIASRYYQESAAPYLVRLPPVRRAGRDDPLMGNLETWETGEDLADIDWSATMAASPWVVPGVTTRRRHFERDPGEDQHMVPTNLDLYLDSSGSMPDPAVRLSPVALAGAILALSALRSGARVQATTWSGPEQIAGTDGFTQDAQEVLAAIVAHFGGSTSFPLGILSRTHLAARADGAGRAPCHIAVVSDDGVVSMFADHRSGECENTGSNEEGIAVRALTAAGGGGTLLLNTDPRRVKELRLPGGYAVHSVRNLDEVRRFSAALARAIWEAPR